MLILGVETSGRKGGIAFLERDAVIASRTMVKEGQRHAQALVRDVAELLREIEKRPAEVDVVAVSIGPGSFTGLRVGVVFAKTFCFATGAKLVAVDTLAAAAMQSPEEVPVVRAVADAQRGDLYVGTYERGGGNRIQRRGEIDIINTEEFAADLSVDDFVIGPGADRVESLLASRCHLAEAGHRHPTAEMVARIGANSATSAQFSDFWTLEPFYIRKSAAEEKWDTQHSS